MKLCAVGMRSAIQGNDLKKKVRLTFFVNSTPEEFENSTLFLWFGLPSTLIRHENGGFRKHSTNWRNLKTPASRYRVDGKRSFFQKGGVTKFTQTQTQNHRRLLRFQISPAKCGRGLRGGKEFHNMRWLTINSPIMITITGTRALFLTSKWLQPQLPIHKGIAFSARNNREPLSSVVELVQTDSLR